MKRQLLLPTDFSDNAWSAAQYAIELFSEEKCTFYFLNSLALSYADSRAHMTTRYIDTLTENSNRQLNELKAKAEQHTCNANHDFQVISTSEDLIPAINRTVQRRDIDLVVMGTKGATGVNKYFLGSNTIKIVQHLRHCPMLAVPDAYIFTALKRIAFPTDFSRGFEINEIRALKDFADLFSAHIHIVYITSNKQLNEMQEQNMGILKNYLEDYEHTFHLIPKSTTKSDEITEFIIALKIDVLVMVNYKHSFIEGITKEPIIKTIGFSPLVPFLVIPE